MKFIQKTVGAVPSPFDCWLTLLGIKTLSLRMDRHCENAMAVAEFLESHSKVKSVTYPGLKSHPQYEIAKEQMSGFIVKSDGRCYCEFVKSPKQGGGATCTSSSSYKRYDFI